MAHFIDFQADASDVSDDENNEMEVDNPTLIDDAVFKRIIAPHFLDFLIRQEILMRF